jgi:hypothetical protein
MSNERQFFNTAYTVALWRAGCFEAAYLFYRSDEFASEPGWTYEAFFSFYSTFALSYCARAELTPMPGDAVIGGDTFEGAYWSDVRGRIAIIDGVVGEPRDSYRAVFNAQEGGAFRGPQSAFAHRTAEVVVSCSGGPTMQVLPGSLTLVGNIYAHFWRWLDIARADGRDRYRLLVPLWRLEQQSGTRPADTRDTLPLAA